MWLPAPLGEQEAMGWVGVRIDRRPDWAVVAMLVERAHRHVAPAPRPRPFRKARLARPPA